MSFESLLASMVWNRGPCLNGRVVHGLDGPAGWVESGRVGSGRVGSGRVTILSDFGGVGSSQHRNF